MGVGGSGRGGVEAVRAQYAREARDYERRWAAYLDATLGPTREELDLPPAARLLDVACGTGALLRRLRATHPAAVLCGVDVSAPMLAVARARAGAETSLAQADAARLPFADATFDAVVSASALHHWPRPERVLAEMARVVRPGGRVVLTDWSGDHLPTRLLDLALRLTDRSHHRVYGVRRVRELLAGAGLDVARVRRFRLGVRWGFYTVTAHRPAAPSP